VGLLKDRLMAEFVVTSMAEQAVDLLHRGGQLTFTPRRLRFEATSSTARAKISLSALNLCVWDFLATVFARVL
jgi:hypothetical protein